MPRRAPGCASASPEALSEPLPAFAETGVDYAQLHKTYEAEATGPGRYSPPKVIATEKTPVLGAPVAELVSTSYVERQNLTVRMCVSTTGTDSSHVTSRP